MKKIILTVCLSMLVLNAFAIDAAQPVIILSGHKAQVRAIAFTDDSKQIITASFDSFIRVWNLKTGENTLAMGQGAMIESMVYSPNGKYIASAGRDASLKLWDAKTGRLLSVPGESAGNIFSLAFSPDSDFIAAGGASSVNIWKTGDLKKPFRLDTGGNWAKTAVFSTDGRFFLTAGGNRISVWAVEFGDIISAVTGKGGIRFGNKRDFDFGCMVFDADFSPDSQYFSACGDDGTIKTWRVEDGLVAWKQPAHNGIALCLAFSGDFLATAGKDGMINFFGIKSGRPVFSIAGCAGQAVEVAFSGDGKYIAAACGDNSVPVWRVHKAAQYEFGNVRTAVLIAGFLGLAGIIALVVFIFRKKQSVKDWKV